MHKFQVGAIMTVLLGMFAPGLMPQNWLASSSQFGVSSTAPALPDSGYDDSVAYDDSGLESRVSALESKTSEHDAALSKTTSLLGEIVGAMKLTQAGLAKPEASTGSQAAGPVVESQTVVKSAQQGQYKSAGAVSVKEGATSQQVVEGLNALGYRSNQVGYGSTGSSVQSYGSTGSSSVASYYYSVPYQTPAVANPSYYAPAYLPQPTVQYRQGLFGTRYSSYGSYGAPKQCQMVNGQWQCN